MIRYPKGWRYYLNITVLWTSFFVILGIAGYAMIHPPYWLLVLALWSVRAPYRSAVQFAFPFRRIGWLGNTDLEFREITFKSRDGSTLFGRFLPARNGATIIILHGLGGTHTDMLIFAELLVHAGFGVFMIDLRAHGSSDGDTSTFGLKEADDVAGAVDYLLTRLDVNGQKIGAFGISLGAQAALRAALKTEYIRALVLEGLGPVNLSDHGGKPASLNRWLNLPFNWLHYRLFELMTGGGQVSVIEVIGKISPRPILFIAGGAKDIYFTRIFYQAAKDPKELWELPNADHGAAILGNSEEYAKRVVIFFKRELKVDR